MMKKCSKLVLLLSLFFIIAPSWGAKTASATRVAWLPGSEKLLVINAQQRPLLWDTVAECPFYFHNQHNEDVIQVVVSDNARLAVSSTIDKKIKIWDVATGAEKHEIIGFNQPASAIAFTKGAKTLLLGDWSGVVKQWDLDSFTEQGRFKAFDSAIFSMALYYPNHLIALGSADGEILLWDMQLGQVVHRFFGHKQAVSAIKFTNDGRYIVSAGDDGQLLIWNYADNKLRNIKLKTDLQRVQSLDVSSDGQYILVGLGNGLMYLVDLQAGEIVYQSKLSNTALQLVKFKNNFEALLVDRDYRVWSFELATRKFRAISEISEQAIIPQSMETYKGQNWSDEQTGMEFSWINGGCFDMGCDAQGGKGCASDNMPAKNVCIDDYWIAKNEVTAPQWEKVMGANLSRSKIHMALLDKYVEENGVAVASGVSWHGAQDFVCRLNKISRADFRMPTEAEWEYACSNATETRQLKQINLGEKVSKEAQLTPPARATVDLQEMHSGVSEWVLDMYNREGYGHKHRYNPLYLENSLYYFYNQNVPRVKRGGGWDIGRTKQECIVRQFNSDLRGRDPKTGLRLTIH